MKLARRARSPATEDSTISRPCPWWRIRPATASRADARPVKLVVITAAAATGSRSSTVWSPRTPTAAMTRSKSPKRSKTPSAKAWWWSVSVASKATDLDHRQHRPRWPRRTASASRGPVPAGQYHRPAAGRHQPGHDGPGDLRGATEYQN